MKSEKVNEYLGKCIEVRKLTFCAADIEYAAGLAEQEAEERMRRKAFSAFDDMWFEDGEDGEFEPDYEYHRRNFIQKLTEE